MSAHSLSGENQGGELIAAKPMRRASSSSVLRSEVREVQPLCDTQPLPTIYKLQAALAYRHVPNVEAADYTGETVYRAPSVVRTAALPEPGSPGPGRAAGLSNDHIRSLIYGKNRKPARIELYRGGSLVKCSREMESLPPPPGSKRGAIQGFSRRSRSRMIQTQAKIRFETEELPYFMGNTCPDNVPDADHVIASWGRFTRRFQRRFPKGALLWRKEIKDRKSGTCAGQWVPHYHSFAYNCQRRFEYQEERGEWVKVHREKTGCWAIEIYCLNEQGQKVLWQRDELPADTTDRLTEWWSRNWYEAMGSGEIKHYLAGASFEEIKTVEGVRYYTSKYMAKVELAGLSPHCKGRWWGIVARQNIPWAERVVIECTDKEAVIIMRAGRRYVLGKAKRKFRCNNQSMNYLVTDPSQWEKLVQWILDQRNVPF